MFVTKGEEGNLGGKAAEPSTSSSEATGSNKSVVMRDPESTVLVQRAVSKDGGERPGALLARRTRTVKLCSFDARSKGQPWPLPYER